MKCKFCRARLEVRTSRVYEGKIYRKRVCPKCGSDYYTEEDECPREKYLVAVSYEKTRRDLAKLDKKTNV